MDCVVISLGGSILVPGDNDSAHIKALALLIRSLAKKHRLVLVCGGGRVARYYISIGRELRAGQDQLDEMGIEVTRLNAGLLQIALGDEAAPRLPRTIQEAEDELRNGKIVVMGGTDPGHTTDAVSAMVAKRVGAARIVNATSVDAAYSADPLKHPDATRFSELTHKQLFELVNKGLHRAGPSDVFDKLGAEIALKANIPILIVSGRDLEEIESAVNGRKVKGTIVRD